jgi:hypothetical protein
VLFIGYLKSKYIKQANEKNQDMSEFEQFGAVFDGKFNQDDCYDRKVLC